MSLITAHLDELQIVDEASFAHVAVYAQLKRVVSSVKVAARGTDISWDRATFLNLTFWNAEGGGDVLCENSIPADVVAHIAWHQVANHQLAGLLGDTPSALGRHALLFAESIASAFDLYLVGRLLRNRPDSDFIETQVSAMAEAAEQAGLSESDFAALLEAIADDPERAFEDLRALLFDIARALLDCGSVDDAQLILERFDGHRFISLLHHYQLSNWLLYTRAYGPDLPEQDRAVLALDATLRSAAVSLDWLIEHWVEKHPVQPERRKNG